MANFIITCDDTEPSLGNYFKQCKDDIEGFLNEQEFAKSLKIISGLLCNRVYVDLSLEDFTTNRFIFIAYSHGRENCLNANEEAYVRAGENSIKFANSFFYSNACSCGKELGPKLIEDGCLAFIGYEKEVQVLRNHSKISQDCDNAVLYAFLNQDITIIEAFSVMKRYFNQQIDNAHLNLLDQAVLIDARDALVFYGDKNLKKEDFFIRAM